ncbi:hypothetical protein MRX96_056857 [Rhipicephalus microplus]
MHIFFLSAADNEAVAALLQLESIEVGPTPIDNVLACEVPRGRVVIATRLTWSTTPHWSISWRPPAAPSGKIYRPSSPPAARGSCCSCLEGDREGPSSRLSDVTDQEKLSAVAAPPLSIKGLLAPDPPGICGHAAQKSNAFLLCYSRRRNRRCCKN